MSNNLPNNFFEHFIKFNGFKYDPEISSTDNFENLIRHLKCDQRGRSKLLNRFQELNDINFVEPRSHLLEEHKRDLTLISKIETIYLFFEYFDKKYNIPIKNISVNYLSAFNELSEKRGWTNVLNLKKSQFYNLSNGDKEAYLNQNFKFHKLKTNPKLSLNFKFKKLVNFHSWKNYYRLFKTKFSELIARDAEGKFQNLEDLKMIISRYDLMPESEVPNDFDECYKLIKTRLYVNIYDFCNPKSEKKFEDLTSLAEYTISNSLFFPLEVAKENICYKVLLKPILGL